MSKEKHDEYVQLVKDNLTLKYKRYYEVLSKNGICRASNRLAEKIEIEERLLEELKHRIVFE